MYLYRRDTSFDLILYREKLKEAQEELTKAKEELATTNESLKSKTTVVQKLQKLGRSYRMKFEEATKELEELKEATLVHCMCFNEWL